MKLRYLLPILTMSVGLFVSCNQADDETVDSIIEGLIKKAQDLKDNTYAVIPAGGEAQTFTLSQEESQWHIGLSNIDRTQKAIKVNLMDEDPELSTVGWGTFELPVDIDNQLTTIDQNFCRKYSWSSAKFSTMRTGKQISLHMGSGGNIKLDGRSHIWLKHRNTKSYSGQYQFLFAFAFDAEVWDSEANGYVPDGEYIIYGNAIVNEYFPTLDYFRVTNSTNWVQVGKSVAIDFDWTDGAEFDNTKVELVSQSKSYSFVDSDEGYFSWDAATRTLTAIKSSDNSTVFVKFAYEGTDLKTTYQIATGPGWDYTSFSLEPTRLVMNRFDALPLSVSSYTPTNLAWHWDALELEPTTDTDADFYYDKDSHKLYNFDSKPGKTYNIRLRVRNNYSVSAPLEVYVVDQRPTSFRITPEDGGTVAYGMGLELSVTTTPEDCYWNWADVELIPRYDDDLIFTGNGGRDDHPKLRSTRSYDTPIMGVQVGFRLKYDHSKTSYIYVTLD